MHSRPGRSDHGTGAGILLAIVAGLVAVSGAIVALTSVIAGVLAGSGPVVVGLTEAPSVLASLPGHLDDPAAAWPADVRGELPDRTTLLGALLAAAMLVVGLIAAVGTIVLRVARGGSGRRAKAQRRDARWAKSKDLKELRVRGPQRGRVILGRAGADLVAAEPRASVMVVAPSQSGKTTGLAIPAILEWDGPVLATSIKGDLAHDTLAARARVGDVQVFDPTQATGLSTASWSPVAASASWESARRTAARLLEIGQRSGNSPDETFWRPAAARYLSPLLLAASYDHATMGDVLSWIATDEQEHPSEVLKSCADPSAHVALDELKSVWEADPRYRTSVQQTTLTALDAWREPRIAAATCAGSTISASGLLDGCNTLYLSAPAQDQRRLRGLFTALIADVVAEAFARSQATGRPIDPPLLLCLDEAANVAPLPNLDEIASTGPGQGVQLLSVFQNLSQVTDRWGRDRAETIVANHRARLFGSGIGDRSTLDYLGAVLGEEEVERVSKTKQRMELEAGSKTTSRDFKRLAPPNRVRQAEENTALLVYGRLPPAWIALRPWYRDRRLRRAAEAPAPALVPVRGGVEPS